MAFGIGFPSEWIKKKKKNLCAAVRAVYGLKTRLAVKSVWVEVGTQRWGEGVVASGCVSAACLQWWWFNSPHYVTARWRSAELMKPLDWPGCHCREGASALFPCRSTYCFFIFTRCFCQRVTAHFVTQCARIKSTLKLKQQQEFQASSQMGKWTAPLNFPQ